jgi:hypothetical protein
MLKATDKFPALWWSLSDTQRKFLLNAYEIDKQLPHSEGMSKMMPPIGWRTVGLMSGVNLNEVEEFVRILAELRLIYILDSVRCEMAVICTHHLRELEEARCRRRWDRIGLAVAVLTSVLALFWQFRS